MRFSDMNDPSYLLDVTPASPEIVFECHFKLC